MNSKGVIFDLDGVICFTDEYHYSAWQEIAAQLGVAFDRQKNDRLRGVSRMESLEIILEDYGGVLSQEQKFALAEKKNARYKQLLASMSPADLSDEVKDTLLKLREKGVKLAIGSSSKNAGYILEKIGLNGFFDAVSDGNNIVNSKPDPEVFVKAAQMLSLSPEDCLVVEDAEAGIEAACRGGFKSVGMGGACASLKKTYGIKNFSEIINIIEEAK